MSNLLLKLKSFFTNDTVARVVKTVVEVAGAQAALYTTVVPNPPTTKTSAALAAGAGALALVWNLAIQWATTRKNARLTALAQAIDAAVAAQLAIKAEAQKDPGPSVPAPPVGVPATATGNTPLD